MVKIENHCCDCAVPNYPCRGSHCPLRRVEVHYCDRCGSEITDDEIHDDNGYEYCDLCRDKLYN
jgi:hypothetical protein